MSVLGGRSQQKHLMRKLTKAQSRGGVEDIRLEAKAKDTKKSEAKAKDSLKEDRHSRPRTGMLEAKDQGTRHKCSPKKRSSKKLFRQSPIHRCTVPKIFDWWRPKPQITCNDVIKIFKRGSFCGTKISHDGRSEIAACWHFTRICKGRGLKLI